MIDQLNPGSVLVHNEQLFIVESFDGDSVEVGNLGRREVHPQHMFSEGDNCPVPGCDGTVESVGPGERRCSSECLQWELNHRVDGEDCPSCDDGSVVGKRSKVGKYTIGCSDEECGRYAFGPEHWREYWWPSEKQEAIEYITDSLPFDSTEIPEEGNV